jgi:2-polyprenyl-3-methyl-5-hydroxy-6-metoxy-1,4-benzoquinol methylase
MTAILKEQDAYGDALLAKARGDDDAEAVIERDDGYVDIDHIDYLSPFRQWSRAERAAAARAQGPVLDVGCGPGRLARHLQDRGHEVVGIDVSPGAVQAARELGVRDVHLCGAAQVSGADGPFDTIAMFGNNLGLLRDARHA